MTTGSRAFPVIPSLSLKAQPKGHESAFVFRDPCVMHFGPGTAVNLPEVCAGEMFRRSTRRRFAQGETLFHSGDAGECMYLLCEGRVGLRVMLNGGHSVLTAILGHGEVVGLNTVFDPSWRHSTSAVALAATHARAIRRDDVLEIAADSNQVYLTFGRLLAREVAVQSQRSAELCWSRSDSRVKARLLELVDRFGRTSPDGLLKVSVTHEEIADFAGVARPTATAVLQEGARLGLLRTERRRVEIVDLLSFKAWVEQ
jgi:CRP/FNR family transcriptional regulator, cyclic AMP receptor protein